MVNEEGGSTLAPRGSQKEETDLTLRESQGWAHRQMTGEGTLFFKILRLSSVQASVVCHCATWHVGYGVVILGDSRKG